MLTISNPPKATLTIWNLGKSGELYAGADLSSIKCVHGNWGDRELS